jgi:membrane-bound ClpP family serine protease
MSVWIIAIGLVLMGFILMVIEVFVIPGFNVFGILGFISLVGGIYYAYANLPILEAHLVLFISIVFGSILIWRFIKSGMWKKFILETQEDKSSGFHSGGEDLQNLMGKTGIAVTTLRPAGKADIEGQKVDVVTEGGYIDVNSQVKVIRVEGVKVVVRKV